MPNEAGSAVCRRGCNWTRAIRRQSAIADGHLHLAQSAGPRFLATAEPIAETEREVVLGRIVGQSGDAALGDAAWASCLRATSKSLTHLNVIELAHQTPLVHEPGAFRFMHRHPPEGSGGVNMFTSTGCTPGSWHHLVSVKTPTELRLYLNGQLTRRLAGAMGSDEAAYQIAAGRAAEPRRAERQFVGSLDELAVYPYALSDAEIQRHYRLLAVGGAE